MAVKVEDLLAEIAGVAGSLAGAPQGGTAPTALPSEDAVWGAYARVEKTVAILKTRLGAETPGVFRELPKAGDQAQLLKTASARLLDAAELLRGQRLLEGLAAARDARDCLRGYLASARRARLREARAKKRASVTLNS